MAEAEAPRPLQLPVRFPDLPAYLIAVNVPRTAVPDYLGPPMLTAKVEELGNADFWAFDYPCGLQVAYRFLHAGEGGLVRADSPEIQHVLRHIPFSSGCCEPIEPKLFDSEIRRLLLAYPERQAEIESLRSYQVWRQGTDGNPFKVGERTSKRDADCWVRHFDSLGHHQHYWFSKVDPE